MKLKLIPILLFQISSISIPNPWPNHTKTLNPTTKVKNISQKSKKNTQNHPNFTQNASNCQIQKVPL